MTLLCDTVGELASLKPFSLCIYQLDRLADTFHPQANYVENHTCGLLLLCYFIEKRDSDGWIGYTDNWTSSRTILPLSKPSRATLRDPQGDCKQDIWESIPRVCSVSCLSNALSALILQLYEGKQSILQVHQKKKRVFFFFLNKRNEMELNSRPLKIIILLAFRCEMSGSLNTNPYSAGL